MTTSAPSRTVECKYNGCGKLFTSKPRMKEHVLLHLETDPPIAIFQHALIQYRSDGGWTVVRDLTSQGESSSGPSQMESEIEKFTITDILPTDSQVGNITTTTTTSGGTTSQPNISFSPALPDRPSQISLPSQNLSPLRPFNSLPNPTSSQPASLVKSMSMSISRRSTSRDPPTPFVHSAPHRSGIASASPSPTIARKRLTGNSMSPIKKRTRLSASPFIPDTQAISSTPRSQSNPRSAQPQTQTQTQSDSSQFPPSASGSSAEQAGSVPNGTSSGTPGKEARRTFGFGEALGLSEQKTTPDIRSGVTFGFGTR